MEEWIVTTTLLEHNFRDFWIEFTFKICH